LRLAGPGHAGGRTRVTADRLLGMQIRDASLDRQSNRCHVGAAWRPDILAQRDRDIARQPRLRRGHRDRWIVGAGRPDLVADPVIAAARHRAKSRWLIYVSPDAPNIVKAPQSSSGVPAGSARPRAAHCTLCHGAERPAGGTAKLASVNKSRGLGANDFASGPLTKRKAKSCLHSSVFPSVKEFVCCQRA